MCSNDSPMRTLGNIFFMIALVFFYLGHTNLKAKILNLHKTPVTTSSPKASQDDDDEFPVVTTPCKVYADTGRHTVKVTAYYWHKLPNATSHYSSTVSRQITGPGWVTGTGEGHPAGIRIYIDNQEVMMCGVDPNAKIFIGDFETGDLSDWSWNTGRPRESNSATD